MEGKRFGRLIVLESAGSNKFKKKLWKCQCDCGNTTIAIGAQLRNGSWVSCGCYRFSGEGRKTHGARSGGKQSALYTAWMNMKARCENAELDGYQNYGGRGITVYPAWAQSFEVFAADVPPHPGKGYSLDRIGNNGNYEPGNVRWATRREQNTNKRDNRLITYAGKTQTLVEWAEELGVPYMTLFYRFERGMDTEKAMTPAKMHKSGRIKPYGE